MNFFVGIAITAAGAAIVIYTDWLVTNFGHMSWAEDTLGIFGGTRTIIKVIGVIATFVGLMTIFGLQDIVLGWIAGFLIPSQFKGA